MLSGLVNIVALIPGEKMVFPKEILDSFRRMLLHPVHMENNPRFSLRWSPSQPFQFHNCGLG